MTAYRVVLGALVAFGGGMLTVCLSGLLLFVAGACIIVLALAVAGIFEP